MHKNESQYSKINNNGADRALVMKHSIMMGNPYGTYIKSYPLLLVLWQLYPAIITLEKK